MFFITYFVVIATKTYTTLVLTYLYPCMTKLRRKSHNLSQNRFFGRQNNLSPYVPLKRVTVFAPWRSQNSLCKRKDLITGNSFVVLGYASGNSFLRMFRTLPTSRMFHI